MPNHLPRLLLPLRLPLLLGPLLLGAATPALAEGGEEAAVTPDPLPFLELEGDVMVTVEPGTEEPRLAQISGTFELTSPEFADLVRPYFVPIRYAILMTVSDATMDELTSNEGREALRRRVTEAVREVLKGPFGTQPVIKEFYFTKLWLHH